MNKQNDRAIVEKLKELPPERVEEAEDFVDFLRARNDDQRLTQAATKASAPAFNKVWDNPDDADYDQLS
jgi:hypothetical protein